MENYNSNFTYAKLIFKYLKDDLDMQEKAELDEWLTADTIHQQLFKQLTEVQNVARELEVYAGFDKDEARLRLMGQISSKHKTFALWPVIISAAAIVAIAFGIYFFNAPSRPHPDRNLTNTPYTQDIAPGKNRATLTLAGRTINLSDARAGIVIGAEKITYDDGTTVNEGVLKSLTVATPRGGTYQVSLPDGTKVWLNSASRLTYAATFDKDAYKRRVQLVGEAYFEVAKDKRHPFVVNSQNMELTVLGTHFNVNAYPWEGTTKATLLEGSVRVASFNRHSGNNGNVILKVKQQASVSGSSGITVKEVDLNAVTAWKNGYFDFNEHLGSIMDKVAMWYDVEIEYDSEELRKIVLQGEISRNRPLSEILNMITYTGDIHFEIKGRRIIVKK
jgi:transmembrane sensor